MSETRDIKAEVQDMFDRFDFDLASICAEAAGQYWSFEDGRRSVTLGSVWQGLVGWWPRSGGSLSILTAEKVL